MQANSWPFWGREVLNPCLYDKATIDTFDKEFVAFLTWNAIDLKQGLCYGTCDILFEKEDHHSVKSWQNYDLI